MKETFKGVNKITKIINDFLKPFDATAAMGSDFSYWYYDNKIQYTLVMPENSKDYFIENFHRLAPDINCDAFLISILHELGHHETLDLIDDKEYELCCDIKYELQEKIDGEVTEEEEAEIHQQYFNLPDEREATTWAINYIREHTEEVEKFWKKLSKAIMRFYKINKINIKEEEYGNTALV